MFGTGQTIARNPLGMMFSTPSLTPLAHPTSNPNTSTSSTTGRSRAFAGAALGTVALTAPVTAFAADPCDNQNLSVKGLDTYSTSSWFDANPELRELVCQSPHPIESKIGRDTFDIFAPLKSPDATLDALTTAVDALPFVEVERPVGDTRDAALGVTMVLGMALAMRMIFKDYTKLVNLPGTDDPAESVKWAAYINGITVLGRLGTDAWVLYQIGATLSAGNVNSDVLYAYFAIWAAMSGVWALAAKFGTSMSGWALKFTNYFNRPLMAALPMGVYNLAGYDQLFYPTLALSTGILTYMYAFGGEEQKKSTIFNQPTISSGGIKPTTGKNIVEFVKSMFLKEKVKVDTDTVRTDMTYTFSADSEKILHDLNADKSISLGNLVSKVGFNIVGTSNFETILPALQELQSTLSARVDSPVAFSVSGKRTEVLKNAVVQPGQGEIIAGSTIISNGKPKYLHQNLKVTAETGPIKVKKGKLVIVESYALDRLKKDVHGIHFTPAGTSHEVKLPEDIVFTVTTTGNAQEVVPLIARTVTYRDMSDDLIPLVSQTPQVLRRAISRPALKLVPKAVRHTLRNWFVPNSLTVSVSVPEDQFDDVVTENVLSSLGKLSVQNRWIGTLRGNPTIPIGVTQLDWMFIQAKNKKTQKLIEQIAFENNILTKDAEKIWLSLPKEIRDEQSHPSDYKIRLRLPESLKKHPTVQSVLSAALEQSVIKGRFSNSLEIVLTVDDAQSLARSLQGNRKVSKQIRIVLDNGNGVANGLANLTEIEKIAGQAGAGSSMNYNEFINRPAMTLLQSAGMLANTVVPTVSYGRFGIIVGLVFSSAWISFPLTSGTKYLQGFEDPKVYFTSGKRIFLTQSLNRISGPTIIASVQESGYSAYKFYMPGMTALTIWEVFNELKEADVTLYKQKVRDLLGENRLERRMEIAKDIQDYERLVANGRPEHREEIIKARLLNFMSTGVSVDGDAEILKKLYEDGQGDPSFELDFLVALIADDAFVTSVVSNADVKAFFASEISKYENDIQLRADQLGLGEPTEVLP